MRRAAVRERVDRLVAWGDRQATRGDRLLRGRGVRRAWLVVASVAAVAMLAVGTMQVASVLAHEERTEVTELPAAGVRTVEIDNRVGSTAVVGVEDADTIVVRAQVSDSLRGTGHRVEEREGVVAVRATCPLFGGEWCSVDYTIEVPADVAVDVHGARRRVEISDVAGPVTVETAHAGIRLARIAGDVDARSRQGSIEALDLTAGRVRAEADQGSVALEFAVAPRDVWADTDQGSIEILVPDDEDVFYATDTDSDQGSVNDRVRFDPDSDRTIVAHADQGSVTLAYAR